MTVANKCLIFPKWHNNPHQENKLWLSSSDMPGQNRGIRCNYQESLKERHCRKSAVLSGADRSTVPEKWIEQKRRQAIQKIRWRKRVPQIFFYWAEKQGTWNGTRQKHVSAQASLPVRNQTDSLLFPALSLLYTKRKIRPHRSSKNARSSDLASVLSAQVHLFTRYRVSSERWRRLRPKPSMHRKTKLQRLP